MTDNIVSLINKHGWQQGFEQLKILNKDGNLLTSDDTAWIAGAEFEDIDEINKSLGGNDQDEDNKPDKNDKEQVQNILESE